MPVLWHDAFEGPSTTDLASIWTSALARHAIVYNSKALGGVKDSQAGQVRMQHSDHRIRAHSSDRLQSSRAAIPADALGRYVRGLGSAIFSRERKRCDVAPRKVSCAVSVAATLLSAEVPARRTPGHGVRSRDVSNL